MTGWPERKTISIEIDGPLSKDVKKVEVGGVDITNMLQFISISVDVDKPTSVMLKLVAPIKIKAEGIESVLGLFNVIDTLGERVYSLEGLKR